MDSRRIRRRAFLSFYTIVLKFFCCDNHDYTRRSRSKVADSCQGILYPFKDGNLYFWSSISIKFNRSINYRCFTEYLDRNRLIPLSRVHVNRRETPETFQAHVLNICAGYHVLQWVLVSVGLARQTMETNPSTDDMWCRDNRKHLLHLKNEIRSILTSRLSGSNRYEMPEPCPCVSSWCRMPHLSA